MLACLIFDQISAFCLGSTKLDATYNLDGAEKNIHIGTQPESNTGSTTWASHFTSVNLSEVTIFFSENIGVIIPT